MYTISRYVKPLWECGRKNDNVEKKGFQKNVLQMASRATEAVAMMRAETWAMKDYCVFEKTSCEEPEGVRAEQNL